MTRLLWLLVPAALNRRFLPCEDSARAFSLGALLGHSEAPSEEDLTCIGSRQVFGSTEGIFAVESSRCRHGFPRAFVRLPVTSKVSSGMLRLSCPFLVKAIDEWEANGGIEEVNAALHESEDLQASFVQTNQAWQEIRRNSVSPEQKEYVSSIIGAKGLLNFMDSGIIGVSQNKTDDVKCIHAHVADYLIRGGMYLVEMGLVYVTFL